MRLLRLGLSDVDLLVPNPSQHGRIERPDKSLAGAALLYPTSDAVDIADLDAPPSSLVVVDGTWSTARKVIRDNPWLASLPRVKVEPPRPGNYRIRRAPNPARQVSTVEAVVYALQTLEGHLPGFAALLAAFDAMVDRQLALQVDRSLARLDSPARSP